jgi:hypothetical protein
MYQQSSKITPELLTGSLQSRSRAARVSAEAEMIRDVVLASSGLLSAKIGGPRYFRRSPKELGPPYNDDKGVASKGEDVTAAGSTFIRRTAQTQPC